jgi:hypothetical protein
MTSYVYGAQGFFIIIKRAFFSNVFAFPGTPCQSRVAPEFVLPLISSNELYIVGDVPSSFE